MKIEYLSSNLDHLSTVAAWLHAEFGYLSPSITLEQRTEKLRQPPQNGHLPVTFIALSEKNDLLGCASIYPTTLTHKHLSPWLSTVFVPMEHRRKGVASALSLHAATEASAMGYPTLYLFTPRSEPLYSSLGWHTIDRSDINGLPIAIMSRPTTT